MERTIQTRRNRFW